MFVLLLLQLAACGGGGGDDASSGGTSPDADLHVGTFIDSAVSGLGFTSPSGAGVTDDAGQFNYAANETVRFAVGEVVLGEAVGATVLSPLDLVPDSAGIDDPRVLYADRLLKDNRLPPRGFRRSEAAAGTEIILGGVSDSDFNLEDAAGGSGADAVHYRIPLADSVGPYTARVRVLYQSIRPSFVAGLHGDGDRVERFRTMYRMLPPTVEQLASTQQVQN
ncbi:hypothetical protein [Thiohalobacter sp. COW1]|uniref:hypothetical protein n=1 Tax=Thiohalobacter sp. COW1 TaxID=2795687 RepID=UPI001916A9C9|nr:hypothetical protein [Thiohalobacter sp. COW1]